MRGGPAGPLLGRCRAADNPQLWAVSLLAGAAFIRPAPPRPPRSDLLAAVREVAAQVVRIFAQPQLALELFLQLIFEQKVQSALEQLLQLQPPKAPAAQQQSYLQWVAPPGGGLPGCCWR